MNKNKFQDFGFLLQGSTPSAKRAKNYIYADLYIFKFLQLNRIPLELEEIKR